MTGRKGSCIGPKCSLRGCGMGTSGRIAASLLVATGMAILAAPGFAVDEVFQQTYPLPEGGAFQLQNVNGSVQVSGWERDEVEVYALKSGLQGHRDLQRSEERRVGKECR